MSAEQHHSLPTSAVAVPHEHGRVGFVAPHVVSEHAGNAIVDVVVTEVVVTCR